MCGSGRPVISGPIQVSRAFPTPSIPRRSSVLTTRCFAVVHGPLGPGQFAIPSATGITLFAGRFSAAFGVPEMTDSFSTRWSRGARSDWGEFSVRAYKHANPGMLAEVAAGLSTPQKELPPKYFYDHRGSELFEEITRLPEYYQTRTERSILESWMPELIAEL